MAGGKTNSIGMVSATTNLPNTIVNRDSSGNFAANIITAAINNPSLSVSSLVFTDASKNLISGNLSGDVFTSNTTSTISTNAVTYAKFQQISANRLFGNPTGSLSNGAEISLGSTLSFSGATLQTVAISGDINSSANSFSTTLATVNLNVGTFGSATQVGSFTVNGKGLVTAASNVTISGVAPGGAAGGDLVGSTYPNPNIATNAVTYAKFQQITASKLFGNPTGSLSNGAEISLGSTLSFSGTTLQTVAISGDVTSSANSFATTVAKINTVPVASSTVADGQLLIGSTSAANYSAATITGTTNQVNVANASHSITLALPQSIATSSSPQFSALSLNTSSFDFSGVNLQITTNSGSGASQVIRSSLTGSSNQAALYLCRGDATNGNALVRFQTGVAASAPSDWDIGTYNNGITTNTNFVMSAGGTIWFTLTNAGVMNLPQLTASSLVTTDGSKNFVSSNTLSATVLGNITRMTRTIINSGSGTYTKPANATHLRVRVWGSGGGGGGVATAVASAHGGDQGGGGGHSELFIPSPASTYAYSIDAGGAGGAVGANNGSAAGTTTFGTSLISITGGQGGLGRTASVNPFLGNSPSGGVASGGDININGEAGVGAIVLSGTSVCSGSGGNAALGGAGAARKNGTGTGNNGLFPGGGGGGGVVLNGSASVGGGNGAGGLIVVEEYYNG